MKDSSLKQQAWIDICNKLHCSNGLYTVCFQNSQNNGTISKTVMDKCCDQLRVNKWDGPSVRNTIDDAVRKVKTSMSFGKLLNFSKRII